PQLTFDVDVGDGEHHVNLVALRIPHALPDGVDVGSRGPGEGGDHRPVDLARDPLNGLEVAGRRQGEAGFDDVNPEPRQLAGDPEFLIGVEGGARGLLAVAQGRVEDVYALVHQFLFWPFGLSQGIIARSSAPTFSTSSSFACRRKLLKAGRPAWFSRIHVRAKVPSWISRRICRISSRTAGLMTRGPLA